MWKYKNKEFTNPGDYYGFVYKITDDQGSVYFGKKAFSHKNKTKLSKKVRKTTRKRIKIEQKDSGWQEYWGSSKPFLEYISTLKTMRGFKKEILKLCKDRQSLSYWEMHIMCEEKVLFRSDCWNRNILGKFFKNKIHE